MSETEVINNNREEDDGNRRKSEMESILHGQVFPPLSSRKPGPGRPYKPEEDDLSWVVQKNVDDPRGLEDFLIDIPRAGYVSDDTDDESVFVFKSDGDPGPCFICRGPHSKLYCPALGCCAIDLKVEEPYEIICHCGSLLNNGKCSRGCDCNFGRVIDKAEEFKYFW